MAVQARRGQEALVIDPCNSTLVRNPSKIAIDEMLECRKTKGAC